MRDEDFCEIEELDEVELMRLRARRALRFVDGVDHVAVDEKGTVKVLINMSSVRSNYAAVRGNIVNALSGAGTSPPLVARFDLVALTGPLPPNSKPNLGIYDVRPR